MIKYLYYTLLFCFSLIACSQKGSPYKVEGRNIALEDGQIVYLTNIFGFKDSTIVQDNKFKFEIPSPKRFDVYSIIFKIGDRDEFDFLIFPKPEKDKYWTSFSLEKYATVIDGGKEKLLSGNNLIVNIDNPKENLLLFRYDGASSFSDAKVEKSVKAIKSLIDDNTNSNHLMSMLYYSRFGIEVRDLKSLYDAFDPEVQLTYLGSQINNFIEYKLSEHLIPVKVSDLSGVQVTDVETKTDLNMVVFEASYCGPCIKEIPLLKKLHEQFKDEKRFSISSVSIDEDSTVWRQFINRFPIEWPRYKINEGQLLLLEAKYSLTSIPFVVFTNREGQAVKIFKGYDKDSYDKYVEVITSRLNLPNYVTVIKEQLN
ncbi:TlpA family protein disulfide reductase [Sphingobacterium sp. SYP-B4668]|uniref:TlpA family protein disulfide reductase n=1 Tax=Sphingobacterium sp. SYP-B4668 TaxID=2996035 RepID=UPI0022DDBD68|nr:TlpA disulfide reductase family protein [Sphingobacterium sp. SYP-B4668]